MTIDLKTKIINFKNELENINQDLKTKADSGTGWTGTEKADMEKRINHITKKSNPHHVNLTSPLEFDFTDLNDLLDVIGADKTAWAIEKSQLEKDKKAVETERDNAKKEKNDEVESHNKTKLEVANKLTSDLVSNLDNIIKTGGIKYKKPKKDDKGNDVKDTNGNIIYEDATLDFDTTKLEAIKQVVEELKTKGDLSSLDNKFKEVKDAAEKGANGDKGTNYWSMGTFILAGLSFLIALYLLLTKKTSARKEKAEEE